MKKLVILACSKTKIWEKENLPKNKKIKAKDAYQGKVFLYGKRYAENHNFLYLILSAKYGILKPNKLISDYDKKLKNKSEANEIKSKFQKTLKEIFNKYDEIFLIGGDKYYRYVFDNFNNKKFKYIKSKHQADLKIKAKKLAENG